MKGGRGAETNPTGLQVKLPHLRKTPERFINIILFEEEDRSRMSNTGRSPGAGDLSFCGRALRALVTVHSCAT